MVEKHAKIQKVMVFKWIFYSILSSYRLVRESNHSFLVLKWVTEMSFSVLKSISGNSEEDKYFILPNCSLVIEVI
jgi:hypothetical protein